MFRTWQSWDKGKNLSAKDDMAGNNTENGHELGLGEAFWADFWWKINSSTSPIDLDRFGIDLGDPKNPDFSNVPENLQKRQFRHRNQNDNFQ